MIPVPLLVLALCLPAAVLLGLTATAMAAEQVGRHRFRGRVRLIREGGRWRRITP